MSQSPPRYVSSGAVTFVVNYLKDGSVADYHGSYEAAKAMGVPQSTFH